MTTCHSKTHKKIEIVSLVRLKATMSRQWLTGMYVNICSRGRSRRAIDPGGQDVLQSGRHEPGLHSLYNNVLAMPVNGNPAGHPLAVLPHDYIAPICASFMDPQKLQLDWWYWLWKPTKQTVEVLFKWNEKNFLFKTQISLIFSCVHFSQGKIPTKKKNSPKLAPQK